MIPERDDHPLGPADAATADPDPKSLARVETDVSRLIEQMNASIAEADGFVATLTPSG